MSLLTLTPEATRLRRIAKACAAGEISRFEYRESRRQMIDKFSDMSAGGGEDTVPRFDMDVTQRRDSFAIEPTEEATRANWMLWLLMFVVVVSALGLPLWSHADSVIPALKDRDPNPRTSPTYVVERVTWQPPADLAGLSVKAQNLLETALVEIKKQNTPNEHGFNAPELEAVGRFLNAVGVHDDSTRLNTADLQDLRALIASQKARRGVSLVQLEQLAQQLQGWLRARGYPLATAYVPSQTVADDTVSLGVQLGVLASIQSAQSDLANLQYTMTDLIGQRVVRDVLETRLNTLNRIDGIQTQVFFEPGADVGETQMSLRVKQAQRFVGGVALDNHTLEPLGEVRLSAFGELISPRGIGDVLSVRGFTTADPSEHQYAQLGYASPVLGGQLRAAAQLAIADLQLDAATPLEASGRLFDAKLTDTQLFTRTHRREYIYRVGIHDLDWDVLPDQRAWYASAGVEGHKLWDAQQVSLAGHVEVLVGGLNDARAGQDDRYWRLRADIDAWTPVEVPVLRVPAKMVLDVQWQIADDRLPPTLRMGAAGAYINKGFAQGALQLDQGISVSGSLRFDLPIGQWWWFLDATYGQQEGLQPRWRQLSSTGLGWEGKLWQAPMGSLHSRITLGTPLSHRGTGGFDEDGTQIFWSLRYAY